MPPPDENITVGELARGMRDVFTRLEGLARRLEDGQFVRTDLYLVYRESVNQSLAALHTSVATLEAGKASRTVVDMKVDKNVYDGLDKRVADLEDGRTWLVRVVGAFVILTVLGVAFAGYAVGAK